MTDREILHLIYENKNQGMSVLIDTYGTVVYQLVCDVLREVGSDEDVFECICDSFEAFYNNIDDVELSRGSLKGCLGVIAYRRAVNLCCTLSPEESDFREYTLEEMSEALKNADPEFMPEVPYRIKLDLLGEEMTAQEESFDEEFSEDLEEATQDDFSQEAAESIVEEQATVHLGKTGRMFKIAAMAVALVLVITGVVIAADRFSTSKYEETTTTVQTTVSSDPVLSAILSGNEKLIESLIENSLLLTQDIVSFAVESADKLSYETIRHITEAVNEKFGSTGLDSLLEGAILGDVQQVMDELKNRDEMEMTPSERLAFFFSGAFGNSEVIEEFIEKGFDASIKDSSGKTIFDIAGLYGNEDILSWRSTQ